MKTQALNWCPTSPVGAKSFTGLKLDTRPALRLLLMVLAAALPAAAVSIITLWAISNGGLVYVAAAYWSVGLIFLALMVEDNATHGTLLAGSGLALMSLAWLSTRVAPEFDVLAGFLLAAWVAAPALRLLAARSPLVDQDS